MAQFFQPSSSKRKSNKNRANHPHLTVDIEQYNHDGQGIGYVNGKICFVQGALPQEQVKVRVLEQKAKVIKAQTVSVLKPSELRIDPQCQHFSQCGGCQLQFLAAEQQLQLKQQAVVQLFARYCQLEELPWQDSIESEIWHYRRAARIGVWYEKKAKRFIVGFRQAKDKQLTAISACGLLDQSFDSIFADFEDLLPQLKVGSSVTHLELFHCDSVDMVVIRHQKPLVAADKQALVQLGERRGWFMVSEIEKGQFEPISASALPQLFYQMSILGRTFQLDFAVGDFIQVNAGVNQQMVTQAAHWLELNDDDYLLDLFCGIGNFSIPLATQCHQVVAVEGVDAMVERVKTNASLNGIDNLMAYQANLAKDWFDGSIQPPWFNQNYTKVLLDPARAGALGIISAIGHLQAKVARAQQKKVLYVSCDPLTLARDSSILLQQGYRLTKIAVMDMFVHTRHVEVMALFEQ